MQIKNVRSAAQQNAKRDLAAVKEMAKTRGETYLEYARTISVDGICGAQEQRQLRDGDCAGDHSIWRFRNSWTT